MAKSRPQPSALDQVRALLTAAEKKVLESSMGAAVAKASREQVEAAMRRARVLRDKWRDLNASQTRTTKRTVAAGGGNRRTKDKYDVFADAVRRLEQRLTEFAGSVGRAVGGKPGRSGAAKTPKKVRVAASRGARAGVRADLKAAAAEINRKAAPTKAAKAVAKPAVAAATAVKASAPAVPTGRSKKRKKPVAPVAAAAQQRLSFDAARQRSAKTSAAAARFKLDGAKAKRAGHVMASTKRSQARRDGRTR